MNKKIAILALLLTSIAATSFGFFRLTVFDGTAGPTTAAPRQWPVASHIEHPKESPTVILFAHPNCTCTDATLEELTQAIKGHNPAVRILFTRVNHDRPELWAPLVKRAQSIPNATVAWDDPGADSNTEAQRFHAQTSGQILLYSPKGELLFEGGITGSRGHIGDNYGLSQLTAALNNNNRTTNRPAVFGCSLTHFTGSAK